MKQTTDLNRCIPYSRPFSRSLTVIRILHQFGEIKNNYPMERQYFRQDVFEQMPCSRPIPCCYGIPRTRLLHRWPDKAKRRMEEHLGGVVRRKLDMLHYAAQLSDLLAPPGNRLEALKGWLAGYHSIRVNDQWRIVFRWNSSGPAEVRVCDYH